MIDAIGEARIDRTAAEMEVGLAGMAERPLANAVVEFEQRGLSRDVGRRLGRHKAARRRRRYRRLLLAGLLALEAARGRSSGRPGRPAPPAAASRRWARPAWARRAARGAGRTGSAATGRGAGGGVGTGAGSTAGSTGSATGFAASTASPGRTGDGRLSSPRRCALPITALRLTPPRSSAIWLAVSP